MLQMQCWTVKKGGKGGKDRGEQLERKRGSTKERQRRRDNLKEDEK
jgi:hypothetical protein